MMDQRKVISLAQEAQERQAEALELTYNKTPLDVQINELKRPIYHNRCPVENRIKSLHDSLKAYGFLGGIFITKNYHIIDGFYRKEICASIGHDTIPCFIIDCTENQEKLLHLKLNIQVATFDLSDFGLTFPGLNLVEDFGFTAADLHTANQSPSRSEKTTKSSTNNSLMRFNTLLEAEQYRRLKAFKEQNALQNWADVIDMLLQSYEAR